MTSRWDFNLNRVEVDQPLDGSSSQPCPTPVQLRKKPKTEICEYSLGLFALSNPQNPLHFKHSVSILKSNVRLALFYPPRCVAIFGAICPYSRVVDLEMEVLRTARYFTLFLPLRDVRLIGISRMGPGRANTLLLLASNPILPVKAPAIKYGAGRFSFF